MKQIFLGIISAITVFIIVIPLCGCSEVEETYLPEDLGETVDGEYISYESVYSESQISVSSVISSEVSAEVDNKSEVIRGIPELKNSSEINGSSYSFTVDNVYSQGGYYTVSVVGEKRGSTFGNCRLVLSKDGEELGYLDIDIPDGDRFLILDSVSDGLSYGCGVISNMRDFSADDHPDIIQLDFYRESEIEIPQYARFFAVFDGKPSELDIYENGAKKEPRGAHLELRGKGRMVQHLCVYTPSGKSLTVEKYEYIFDPENRRLNRRKVEFLGWNVDN